MHLADAFIQSKTFFISMCVPWELNPQPVENIIGVCVCVCVRACVRVCVRAVHVCFNLKSLSL